MKASRPSSLDPIRNESKGFCLQGPKGPCSPRTEKDRKTAFAHPYSPPESGFNIDLRRPSGQAFSHAPVSYTHLDVYKRQPLSTLHSPLSTLHSHPSRHSLLRESMKDVYKRQTPAQTGHSGSAGSSTPPRSGKGACFKLLLPPERGKRF